MGSVLPYVLPHVLLSFHLYRRRVHICYTYEWNLMKLSQNLNYTFPLRISYFRFWSKSVGEWCRNGEVAISMSIAYRFSSFVLKREYYFGIFFISHFCFVLFWFVFLFVCLFFFFLHAWKHLVKDIVIALRKPMYTFVI